MVMSSFSLFAADNCKLKFLNGSERSSKAANKDKCLKSAQDLWHRSFNEADRRQFHNYLGVYFNNSLVKELKSASCHLYDGKF